MNEKGEIWKFLYSGCSQTVYFDNSFVNMRKFWTLYTAVASCIPNVATARQYCRRNDANSGSIVCGDWIVRRSKTRIGCALMTHNVKNRRRILTPCVFGIDVVLIRDHTSLSPMNLCSILTAAVVDCFGERSSILGAFLGATCAYSV